MSRDELGFRELIDAHLRLQAGCYVSGVEAAPDGGRYLWSEIPEPGFNLAVGTRDFGWVAATARRHGRPPAVLAADTDDAAALSGHPAIEGRFQTRWMTRACERSGPTLPESFDLAAEAGPPPGAGFLSVCGSLYADPAINAVAEAVFLPVLAAARAVPGIETHHLTLSEAGAPVACASIYRAGSLAGLYNVGTRASCQGRGLGALVTRAALAHAAEAGASTVFLQCVAEGPVERLYRRLGFTVVASPVLLVFGES